MELGLEDMKVRSHYSGHKGLISSIKRQDHTQQRLFTVEDVKEELKLLLNNKID